MQDMILVINPGSTSTKVALFNRLENVETKTIRHKNEELDQFQTISDQKDFRKELIVEFIKDKGYDLEDLGAIVGRGGLLKPIPGGTYLVDETMIKDLKEEKYNSHASNLGAILAYEIATLINVNAYIVDPVVVDEMKTIARLSGLKGVKRRSVAHALNQKAVARRLLTEESKDYEKSNIIVGHLGGGISIAAHNKGRMIDTVNALDGEGPYSPERTGALPLYDFAKKIIEENLTLNQIKKIIAGKGGVNSYIDEIDIEVVEERIKKQDKEAELYLEGMCYQIAKGIGEMATVLKGEVDMIILTGGIAYSEYVIEKIENYTNWIAPFKIFPGEMEMEALYLGVMRVLTGEEKAKNYTKVNLKEVR